MRLIKPWYYINFTVSFLFISAGEAGVCMIPGPPSGAGWFTSPIPLPHQTWWGKGHWASARWFGWGPSQTIIYQIDFLLTPFFKRYAYRLKNYSRSASNLMVISLVKLPPTAIAHGDRFSKDPVGSFEKVGLKSIKKLNVLNPSLSVGLGFKNLAAEREIFLL